MEDGGSSRIKAVSNTGSVANYIDNHVHVYEWCISFHFACFVGVIAIIWDQKSVLFPFNLNDVAMKTFVVVS